MGRGNSHQNMGTIDGAAAEYGGFHDGTANRGCKWRLTWRETGWKNLKMEKKNGAGGMGRKFGRRTFETLFRIVKRDNFFRGGGALGTYRTLRETLARGDQDWLSAVHSALISKKHRLKGSAHGFGAGTYFTARERKGVGSGLKR